MSDYVVVALRDGENDSRQCGLPINMAKTGGKLPDAIVMNGYVLTFRTILNDGTPMYAAASAYFYDNADLPV